MSEALFLQPAASSSAAPQDRAATYQAVPAGAGEQHNGDNLVVAAYSILWLILMAWLFVMWRKQASLHAKIDDLEKTLDRAAAKLEKK